MATEKLMSFIKSKAIENPDYRPYCMRCVGLVRMVKRENFYWTCHCGAVHDERAT